VRDNAIQLTVIDMAGTTVADDGLVFGAFESAATAAGVPDSGPERDEARRYVLDTMGQSKIRVFRALFGTEERAQRANEAFERAYEQLIDEGRAEPIDGAAQAITRLRDSGVKVALTTGFSGTTQEKLLAARGWQSLAALVLAPGDGVRGRPNPDLILTALMRLDVEGAGRFIEDDDLVAHPAGDAVEVAGADGKLAVADCVDRLAVEHVIDLVHGGVAVDAHADHRLIQALTIASSADISSPQSVLSKPLNLYTGGSFRCGQHLFMLCLECLVVFSSLSIER